ncbi:MAG: bifunctional 5,10-methylenetetrahydrofolate dehydrogenase/5,10-methenyltetrahydrofolate cyclohydrolase, partial [Candidatus Hinthialibacter sp.]
MTAQILDGKALAQSIRDELKHQVDDFIQTTSIQPGLAVILVGENPASQVYVRNKGKACAAAGMNSIEHKLPADASQQDVLDLIDDLNGDPNVHGILVQLPVPDQIDPFFVQRRVDPRKDVDGFHPVNVGKLWIGQDALIPCTPLGVMEILEHANISIQG